MKLAILHQQPADVAPKESDQGAVWVGLLVRELVMQAVDQYPAGRRVLQTADSDDRKRVFQPQRAVKTAMRQQSVIAEIDPERAKDVNPNYQGNDSGPAEEPWNEREASEQMNENDGACVPPFAAPFAA